MAVFRHNLGIFAAAFAISRPGNAFVKSELNVLRMQKQHILRVVVVGENAGNNPVHIGYFLRVFNEQNLKKPVA